MAMRRECATAVRAAAGNRPVSDAKMQAIEDSISKNMRELARQDRARWQTLSRDQRMQEAVNKAMQDLAAEAKLKEVRAGLQVLRAAETDKRILDLLDTMQGGMTRSQAQIADMQNTENYAAGVRNEALANLRAVLDAAESKDGVGVFRNLGIRLFDMDNPRMTADVVREVFKGADGSTGNAAAKKAAQAWLEVIEGLRVRFNAAGGDIGKIGYGYLSQAHDTVRIVAAGAEKWADFILNGNLLDRQQYVRPDGSLMDDAEIRQMLVASHETLATGGANKTEPGAFKGAGSRANRGSESRVIHFKDGDAWMQYMKEFGEGSLYDSMLGHVSRMTRDLAIIERMGPNAEATFRVQADISKRADASTGKLAAELLDNRSAGNAPEAYWRILKGETGSPENRFLARVGSDLRNVQTAAKITWGPFSAMADVATVMHQLRYQRIPYFDHLRALGRQFNPVSGKGREDLKTAEVIAESFANSVNRFTGDNLTHSLTGRITNATMKVTLMNAWTDAGRNAFADAMMHNYTRKLGKAWDELDEWDRYLMQRRGITPDDWAVITQAKPTAATSTPFVSGPAIRATGMPGADAIANKWTGFVTDQSQFAVVATDMATRAIATGGGMPAGTFTGEAWRSMAQFKAFPIAVLTRIWRQTLETPQGLDGAPMGFGGEQNTRGATVNRVAVLAGLMVTTTLLGAFQTQIRSMLSGKDPINMDPTEEHGLKFWGKAVAAGGGSGFIFDVLAAPMDDPSRQWQGHLGLLGPVAGAAGGLVDVAKGEGPKGDKHHAALAVRWLSDQAPMVDAWQVRAMYEHWVLHTAQEALNPNYLARMQARAKKEWGQEWYWAPGQALPDRAPSFEQLSGRD